MTQFGRSLGPTILAGETEALDRDMAKAEALGWAGSLLHSDKSSRRR
jgi:hypothetical protein